ncbi:hypothetical protein RA273_27510 [Pseudomonas syringae pv. tagetis]
MLWWVGCVVCVGFCVLCFWFFVVLVCGGVLGWGLCCWGVRGFGLLLWVGWGGVGSWLVYDFVLVFLSLVLG